MRVEVITPFLDKRTGDLRRTGQVITVTKDRGKRMIARGLAVLASKKADKPSEDKAQRPTENKAKI